MSGGVFVGNTNDWVKQMEFLLGEKIPEEFCDKLGRCFHLRTQVAGVYEALKLMGKSINDVIYEEDRKVLREHEGNLLKKEGGDTK